MNSGEASASQLLLTCHKGGVSHQIQFSTEHLVIAGWTGRDQQSLENHIKELELIGIPRPRETPMFYRVGSSLLTMAAAIQVIGRDATGEAEIVLFRHDDEEWITIGSDHTDRKAETMGVTLSKQLCPKPLASDAWALADIQDHWDELILRSFAKIDGVSTLYQEGKASAMRPPWDLVDAYNRRNKEEAFRNGSVMLCGTLSVIGDIRWADAFSVELEDPILQRKLTYTYDIHPLPIEG